MKTNNERLKELMEKHGLRRADVAEILHLAVTKDGQVPAVNKWLASTSDAGNYRQMNDAYLELLEYRLGEKRAKRFKREKK